MNFVVFLLLACWCFCSFSLPLATVSLCGLLCDWCSSRLCLVLLHVVCLPGTSTVLYLSFITPVLLYFLVFLYIPRSPFHLFSSFSLFVACLPFPHRPSLLLLPLLPLLVHRCLRIPFLLFSFVLFVALPSRVRRFMPLSYSRLWRQVVLPLL